MVVVGGGVDLLAELVTTDFDEVENVEGVGTDDGCTDEEELELEVGAGAGAGAGSSVTSTQYDLPTTRFPQAVSTEGFYILCQHGLDHKQKAECLPIDGILRGQ